MQVDFVARVEGRGVELFGSYAGRSPMVGDRIAVEVDGEILETVVRGIGIGQGRDGDGNRVPWPPDGCVCILVGSEVISEAIPTGSAVRQIA